MTRTKEVIERELREAWNKDKSHTKELSKND